MSQHMVNLTRYGHNQETTDIYRVLFAEIGRAKKTAQYRRHYLLQLVLHLEPSDAAIPGRL